MRPRNFCPSSITTTAVSVSATPGPYELADGKIMIIRDLFTNEDVYDWSDVCDHEKVPHCYTLCIVIDPEKMALDEIRVNDISTTFTRPKNYIEHIVGGAVFVREKWDTPMGEVYPVKISDLDKRLEGIQQATLEALLEILQHAPQHADHQRNVRVLYRHDPTASTSGRNLRKGV